jgi:hypothetical protein
MIDPEQIKEIQDKELSSPPEQSWKDRLVEEYLYVDSKVGRLHRFVEWDEKFAKLDKERQTLLVRQLEVMKEYLKVLGKRARLEGVWNEIANIIQ